MTSPVQLREEAIAKLLAAKALAEAPDTDQATFDRAMGEFRSFDRQARTAAGSPQDPAISLADAEQFYTGKATGSTFSASGLPTFTGQPYGNRPGGARSLGSAFVEARLGRMGIGATTSLLEAGSTAVTVPLRSEPFTDPRQAQFVFQLFGEEEAPGGLYSYLKQTIRDLNAAVVEPGAKKPISAFQFARTDDRTKIIAHVSDPIARTDIEDAPNLQTFINAEMQYGLNLALDALVVAALLDAATLGDGTVNLDGIRGAITTLQIANLTPNAIVLSPTDWESVEGEITTTYVSESELVTDALARRLFSLPVVVTNSIADGTAIVGAFGLATSGQQQSAVIKSTGGVRFDISDTTPREVEGETVSDFRLNQVVFRSEERKNIAIGMPTAFVALGGGS